MNESVVFKLMNDELIIKETSVIGILNKGFDNPRNSEGSFLKLKDGRIAFAYSKYSGNSDNDHAPCNICVVYSYDNGKSFDVENCETLVYASDYNEKNVMSVTLRYMNNGDIGLFYLLKHPGGVSEYYLRRYKDDFLSLVGEVKCLPFNYDGYFVVNNDRVLLASDGRWFIPAAYHNSSVGKSDKEYIDERAIVCFFVSDDDGYTWKQQYETLRMADTYSKTGLQEPGLVELNGGVLYCYSRTDRMFQYESVSIDGGEHWFNAQPSRFASPISPLLIKKNPHSGMYYAVWNPIPVYFENSVYDVSWGRTPLVIAQSNDGVHFSKPVIIENDPSKGYCYPAMEFLDKKTVLLAYCGGGKEEGCCLDRTVIRRLTLE